LNFFKFLKKKLKFDYEEEIEEKSFRTRKKIKENFRMRNKSTRILKII
jgi:hypothetical protein